MTPSNHHPVLLDLLCAYPSTQVAASLNHGPPPTRHVIDEAEKNGLAPLLYQFVSQREGFVDQNVARVLKALALRHEVHARTRTRVLQNILQTLVDADLDVVVLKGAALAHMIYETAKLRPMGDIDLLVHKNELNKARNKLIETGFITDNHQAGYLTGHHHIAPLYLDTEGETIIVELHHDALSNDTGESIRLGNLKETPREFSIGGYKAYTLGHIDTLHHLCRHSFEPSEVVKLIQIADIIRYAEKFRDQIDWSKIQLERPFVLNTLRCLHLLTPLPDSLHCIATPPVDININGVGRGFKPLSVTMADATDVSALIKDLFQPPDWWVHIYYNIAPENSLRFCRFIRHPLLVMRWLARRYKIKLKNKFKTRGYSL